jgi:hypothetical protein
MRRLRVRSRLLVSAFGLVAALCTAKALHAGVKAASPIYVNTTVPYASGAIGDARASSDSLQRMQCWANYYNTGSPNMGCNATDAAGHNLGCWSTNATFVNAAASLTGDSFVEFYVNASTGECTYLFVEEASWASPKQP